ncbi:ATP-binding protein [Halotia branconii]|uniref:Anti-sigma regulatory factor n=1 Tax=Halotia branconii CENA392 TaxID=1539056 RepID=A0AAJ6NQ00_9CYAN|nr:anti-sigma regulatory factor [Halotia branconii]WGV24411.1 anti-sigma regulatory factor [Halotia branconii CENA392]
MNNQINLKFNTDLALLSNVLSWFEQINQPPIPNQQIWWQCQTLLIEGFTNIVEHGHRNLPRETPIEITVLRSNEHIEIHILSQSEDFDLEKQLQATSALEENHQERGRGLKIMAAIADKLSYERTADNRYCLFIYKYY